MGYGLHCNVYAIAKAILVTSPAAKECPHCGSDRADHCAHPATPAPCWTPEQVARFERSWYRVENDQFTCGILIRDGHVVFSGPSLQDIIGWKLDAVVELCRENGWTLEVVNDV